MKHRDLIICLFSIITIAGCQKSNNTPSTTPITTTPASKLFGTRTCHGIQMHDIKFFDSINNVMRDTVKTDTMIAAITFTPLSNVNNVPPGSYSGYDQLQVTFSPTAFTFANVSLYFIYSATDPASQITSYGNKYDQNMVYYYASTDSVYVRCYYGTEAVVYYYYP